MFFLNFVVFSENFNFMIVGNSLVLHNFICQITAAKELYFFSNSDIVQPSKFDHDYCDSSPNSLVFSHQIGQLCPTLLTTLHSRFEQKMKEKSQKHLTFQSTTYFCCCQSVCILCFYVLSFLIPSVLNLKLTKIYNIEMSIVLKFFFLTYSHPMNFLTFPACF